MSDSPQEPVALPLEGLTFEEAFGRLNTLAESLESGSLPLTEATAVFEEGMALARRCNALLDEAELKVNEIKENAAAPGPSGMSDVGPAWADLEMPLLGDDWQPEEDLPGGD